MRQKIVNIILGFCAVFALFIAISKIGIIRIISSDNAIGALKTGYSPPDLWGGSISLLPIFIAFMFLFDRIRLNIGVRRYFICVTFSLLSSVAVVCGEYVSWRGGIESVFNGDLKNVLMPLFLLEILLGVALYLPIPILITKYAEKYPIADRNIKLGNMALKYFALYLSIFLIFAIVNGIAIQFDTAVQINEACLSKYTKNNPIYLTLLIKLFVTCFGVKFSIWLVTLLQIIFLALAFSYATTAMSEMGIKKNLLYVFALFYAIHPFFLCYATSPSKDTFLAAFSLMYFVHIGRIASGKIELQGKHIVLLIIIMLGLCVSKIVGLFALIGSAPFLFFIVKRKFVFFITTCSIILFFIFTSSYIDLITNSTHTKVADPYSLMIQQVARITKTHSSELPNESIVWLKKLMPIEQWEAYYDPHISDPIKDRINKENFLSSRLNFLQLWCNIIRSHPLIAADATLCGTIGYWHCDVLYGTIPHSTYSEIREKMLAKRNEFKEIAIPEIETHKKMLIRHLYKIIYIFKLTPIISLIFCIGIPFWILLISTAILLDKKNCKICLLFTFPFLLWIACNLSPVHAELRYILGVYAMMPYIVSISLCIRQSPPPSRGNDY